MTKILTGNSTITMSSCGRDGNNLSVLWSGRHNNFFKSQRVDKSVDFSLSNLQQIVKLKKTARVDSWHDLAIIIRRLILGNILLGYGGEVMFFEKYWRINKDVRVIMSNGYNDQDISQRFAGKKLVGVIRKPYQLASLSAVLQRVFDEE